MTPEEVIEKYETIKVLEVGDFISLENAKKAMLEFHEHKLLKAFEKQIQFASEDLKESHRKKFLKSRISTLKEEKRKELIKKLRN